MQVNTISTEEFKRRTLELLRHRAEDARVQIQHSKQKLGEQAGAMEAAQVRFMARIDVALAGNLTLH